MPHNEFEPSRVHNHPYSPEDFQIAKQFAVDLAPKLRSLLREVVFFGSSARGKAMEIYERDIDVLVILNDGIPSLSNETTAAYRIITEKTAANVSARLHINTLRISAFWEYTLNGDPIAVNMIRDGIPLLNAGFLEPFKTLLSRGAIKPSKGNIMVYMLRAPQTLMASRWHLLQATIDLYWACLDAAHAVLIRGGHCPDSPKEAISRLESSFVKKGMLAKNHLKTLTDLHALSEGIIERSVKDVDGKTYSSYDSRAREFVGEMKRIMSAQASS